MLGAVGASSLRVIGSALRWETRRDVQSPVFDRLLPVVVVDVVAGSGGDRRRILSAPIRSRFVERAEGELRFVWSPRHASLPCLRLSSVVGVTTSDAEQGAVQSRGGILYVQAVRMESCALGKVAVYRRTSRCEQAGNWSGCLRRQSVNQSHKPEGSYRREHRLQSTLHLCRWPRDTRPTLRGIITHCSLPSESSHASHAVAQIGGPRY